jgi:ubiquinone/menaquinone biosynthesis C-methylase UbiE
MRMRRLETWMMRSPVRRWMLRRIEVPRVLDGLALRAGARVLEIGCGDGYGALLVRRALAPAMVVGLDLDPAMLRAARRRLARPPRPLRRAGAPPVSLVCGDATAMAFPDAAFDALVLFGMLHHVTAWRTALAETYRVLVPGGVFAFEEALLSDRPFWLNRWWGHVPFGPDDLRRALSAAGFRLERMDTSGWPPMCTVRAVKPAAD